MRPPISAILAMCLLSAQAFAQGQIASPATAGNLNSPQSTGQHLEQSTGQESAAKPAPHIYKKGDHLSRSYGDYSVVTDWPQHKLMKPPPHMQWVKYGDNYFLVQIESGEITDIVRATG